MVHVLDHPVIQHKLTLLRQRNTSTQKFRTLLKEISLLFAYELTRAMPTSLQAIETPMAITEGRLLEGKKIVLVPVLRAGLGMVEGMLDILPSARVGHFGAYRDPTTLAAVEYFFRTPGTMADRDAIVLDPMLATGHSAAAALRRVEAAKPRTLRFACIVAAPEGIAHLAETHPDVSIYTAAVDRGLNEHGYILPGLGDAGDRLFGTKDSHVPESQAP